MNFLPEEELAELNTWYVTHDGYDYAYPRCYCDHGTTSYSAPKGMPIAGREETVTKEGWADHICVFCYEFNETNRLEDLD